MPYKFIPQPTDNLSVSQNDILNNFTLANSTMNQNHYPFNDLTPNNGKHKHVQIPVGSLPIGLVALDATLYAKTKNTESNFFFSPDNSGKEYQLTTAANTDFSKFGLEVSVGTNTGGWSFLPGGLVIQYISTTGSGNVTITYPTSLSVNGSGVGIKPFCIQVTNLNLGVSGIVSAITETQFTLNRGTGSATFNILIIGPKT